jgi:hypothetical protein
MDQNTTPHIPQAEARQVAEEIARQLDETNPEALAQIERIVGQLGAEKAQEFLQETLKIEAAGGLLVRNKSRRRSAGGTYFYLVRGKVSATDRSVIWPLLAPKPKPPPPPPFDWEERLEIVPKLREKVGVTMTTKLTLIGRPGRIVEKGEVVLTSMQQGGKAPSLPKGLPPLPEEATTYIVYIARKQWQKVAKTIKNPEDLLIVEGLPVLDKRLGTIAVFAQNVTTKLLQAAKREAQQAEQK